MKKQVYWLRLAMVVFAALFMSSCAMIPKPQPDPTNPIHTVAMLPFSNFSNNIAAPNSLRELYAKKFTTKFYDVIPVRDVDRVLQDDFGITLGDQLDEVDFDEIKQKIGADAYLFGNITHYDRTISGVINTNRVRAVMRLVRASDDRVVWSSNIGIKSESKSGGLFGDIASLGSAITDANEESFNWITIESKTGGDGTVFGNLISGLVESAVSTAMDTVLSEESLYLVNRSTTNLRHGPGFRNY